MNYPESVRFLYSLGNELQTTKFGLERIATLLAALNDPQRNCRFVHVAGTNGKGSTCAMIESGLRAAGIHAGLYTSPHLIEPVERIRIAGCPVTHGQFAAAFDRVHDAAERLLADGSIDLHPTYFETVTAMAFVIFRQERVDTAVLEVGMGGRLDATNIVTPRIAVITRVDFDHEAWLGKSLEQIAAQKAGILKAGVPAVFAAQRPGAEAILDRRAAELGIPVIKTSARAIHGLHVNARGSRFVTRGMHIECPLAGEHQVENALTSAVVLEQLGAPPAAIERGIRDVRWPGRMQRVSENPEIILDGAHNPSGARALAAYIERFYSGRRVTLIYGAMRDKSVAEIGAILFPHAASVIVTAPHQERAVRPETIQEMSCHPDLRVAPTLADALEIAKGQAMLSENDVVFVTGSLFLVAEALALLVKYP